MIFKNYQSQNQKQITPLIGVLLLVISIVLLVTTGPIGFIYGLIVNLFSTWTRNVGEYFLKIATSIDQLGNVIMQHLFNLLLIKRTGYKFGNRKETISSAIGKNEEQKTLSGLGKFINSILNMIDRNHSLNSIDYHVEEKL